MPRTLSCAPRHPSAWIPTAGIVTLLATYSILAQSPAPQAAAAAKPPGDAAKPPGDAAKPPGDAAKPPGDAAKLIEALEKDPTLSPETKAALIAYVKSQETAMAPASAAGDFLARLRARLSLSGDLRLRLESSFATDDIDDRHRARLRFRFGGTYKVVEELSVGARLTTGARDDPQSPHVTLGSGFDKLEINIDRLYAAYRPSWADGAELLAGKFAHPFRGNPIYSELVWDADVGPEGISASYVKKSLGPLDTLELRAGEYILLEQSSAEDAYMTVGQVASTATLAEKLGLEAAVGYTWYTDVTPDGSQALIGDNSGNAVVDKNGAAAGGVDYVSGFGILNPILALTHGGWRWPVTLAGEYILNTEASSRNQGWAIGASLGRVAKKGDFRAYYQWQIVEQDAVFSAFSQDDFLFGTNHRSHLFGAQYQVIDEIRLHLWALVSRLDQTSGAEGSDSENDQWRVRFDVDIRF